MIRVHRSGPSTVARARASIASALLTAGCVEPRDRITDPASLQAEAIGGLWSLSLWMGVGVWIAVMVLLAVPLWRARRARDVAHGASARDTPAPPGAVLDEPIRAADPADQAAAQADELVRSRLLWIGGIILPAVILLVLLVASGRVGGATAHVEREGDLVIEVVGHMFWWEVHYPDLGITTANEIHVPVGRPVRLELFSADVIHSFWIPRVHGKIDMIPGHETRLTFEPTVTGRFRGHCAEFCGIAHAQMVAFLIVQEPDEFDEWTTGQVQNAPEPETPNAERGREVAFQAGCASCHAIRGTNALGTVGPDLTDLASRETLAAGIVPNTRENLRELIVDPWALKPGIRMPPTQLADDDLEALLDYLETLD